MKKMLLNVVAAVLTIVGLSGVAMASPAAYADGVLNTNPATTYIGGGDASESIVPDGVGNSGLTKTINTAVNVVIGIVGMLAVIMIIMGGISFVTSQGDTAKVTKARNTILYGVVGLIVVLLAFAIVNFVLSSIFKTA